MSIPESQKHIYDYFIDENGNWFCEGNPINDKNLFKLLSRSLYREGDKYFVKCEGEIHPVRVADAPLWVKYIHVVLSENGEIKTIKIELTDGRIEELDPKTLFIKGDSAIYCIATRKKLICRFGRIAYYEFAKYLDWSEKENVYLIKIGGKYYHLTSTTLPENS